MKVYDPNVQVEVMRAQQKLVVPFREIKYGDFVTVPGCHYIRAAENARFVISPDYTGYLFCASSNECFTPQDFAAREVPFGDAKLSAREVISHDRSLELLNKLIDQMCEDEGGHGHRVCARLAEMGFMAEELAALSFPESDIEDAMRDEEDAEC